MHKQSRKRRFKGSGLDWREKGGGRDIRVDPLRGTALPVSADERKET